MHRMSLACLIVFIIAGILLHSEMADAGDQWLTFHGNQAHRTPAIGAGKHIVLISGDEEYRSEEALPMLAKILAVRYGFRCTVLFAINRATGEIDPNTTDNIPGLQALETADLMVVFTRFRNLPDEQMKFVDAYLQTGKPVVGIRPAVVAFRNKPTSKYAKYGSNYRGGDFPGGFGKQVLGATWISHHGRHGHESTLGIPVASMEDHPILRGVEVMWGPTDVYTVKTPIPHGGEVLVTGRVLAGMAPDAPRSKKPPMPLAWIKRFPTPAGDARVFMTTMGDARDFTDPHFRRLVVNACFWAVGLEDKIPAKTNVDTIIPYFPSPFGFNRFRKALLPRDYARVSPKRKAARFSLEQADHVCYIGNTLADRMQHFGWLETVVQHRFPDLQLVFRHLGFAADELTIRPRSMNFGDPHQHLARSKADVVFAFFGYNESFEGRAGLPKFGSDLRAFISETLKHRYNGKTPPRLVLFSPIAHENLRNPRLPDGSANNQRLEAYTAAMQAIADDEGVLFVDLFHPTRDSYARTSRPLTINGIHPNSEGYRRIAEIIERSLFGKPAKHSEARLAAIRAAVLEKNLRWFNRYRATDGYSTYGRRAYLKFVDGQTNKEVLQRELEILDVMTANRDRKIWAASQGHTADVVDDNLPPPIPVKTNIGGGSSSSSALKEGSLNYLGGEEAIAKMTVAKGMQVNLFASEERFPELVNPVQMAVDTKGRLFVAAWHTYPHWNPNRELNDKLLILPDDDGDGKADRCIVFADRLHNPTGFEFWNGGVLVASAPDILFLKDTDGDDRADLRVRMLHGIDSADTHCNANSFVFGPDGWIYFSEGIFHYTNVETPWGKPLRTKAPMLYRWNPRTGRIENHFHLSPNPHGIAIDRWGRLFATDATTGHGFYVGYPRRGTPHHLYRKRVRPVAGLGLISGTHFPKENRGNLLVCNTIGFLGILQYKLTSDGADIRGTEVEPIVVSSDGNFRPVDVEIGADGALYFLDWHNVIIGHMQHNLRDPSRDHTHGRVYRVTVSNRPLLKPAKIAGEPIEQLLALLESPQDSVRYRARIELSARNPNAILVAAAKWINGFDPQDTEHAHHLLEALWLHERLDSVNVQLLKQVLASPHPLARAAALRVLSHWGDRVAEALDLVLQAARDEDRAVRAEAVVAAAALKGIGAAEVVFEAANRPLDKQLRFNIAQTRTVTDKHWRQALAQGEKLSPAGVAYVLQYGTGRDLLALPRSEPVCLAILRNKSVATAKRIEALRQLRNITGRPLAEILLDELSHNANGTALAADQLVPLLRSLPRTKLATLKPRLTRIIAESDSRELRTAAIATMIEAGEPSDALFAIATQEFEGALAYVESVRLIPDDLKRAAMYGSIKRLAIEPPQHLQRGAARSPMKRRPANSAAADLSAAAVRALADIPHHDAEIFGDMVALLQRHSKHRAAAVEVLRGIPRQHWSKEKIQPLAESLTTFISDIPLKDRTGTRALEAMQLASQLADTLPADAAALIHRRLDLLRVQVVELATVPHRMIYDKERIVVQAGRPVEFRFSNPDDMPHNFSILKPGALEEVGLLAEATGKAPDAAARNYIPPSDKILLSSRLLQKGQSQVLRFQVPAEPGIYPYVCTYPGHWRRMYGALYVVDDLRSYQADPTSYLDEHRLAMRDELLKYLERNTEWKFDDLAPLVQTLAAPRSFEVGRSTFRVANCVACHRLNQEGHEFGPDLTKLDAKKFTPKFILRTLLEPSAEINEQYRTYSFLLDSGRVITGMILEETEQTVKVIVDPLTATDPLFINKEEISARKQSEASLMPQGLLSKLTQEELLDLIAYIYARGNKDNSLFQESH